MKDCLFCKIVAGELPSDKVYDGKEVVGIVDVIPQAPHHYLVIPKKHISRINDVTTKDSEILAEMFEAARKISAEKGIAESGFRLVLNQNKDGGQTVFHLHMHILGGRQMDWPPG